jgi:hypothetical protein
MAKRPYWLPYIFAAAAALCWSESLLLELVTAQTKPGIVLAFAATLPRSKNLNKSDLANMYSIALKDNSTDVEIRIAGFGMCYSDLILDCFS